MARGVCESSSRIEGRFFSEASCRIVLETLLGAPKPQTEYNSIPASTVWSTEVNWQPSCHCDMHLGAEQILGQIHKATQDSFTKTESLKQYMPARCPQTVARSIVGHMSICCSLACTILRSKEPMQRNSAFQSAALRFKILNMSRQAFTKQKLCDFPDLLCLALCCL